MNSDLIDINEMMTMLDIGKNTAYKLLTSNEIRAFKLGKKWKIQKASVLEYIDRQVKNCIIK